MKYYITIYAITLFSLISFNFQCGKEDLQPMKIEEVAQFEKHLYIDPVKKTYNVGDTIWIKTNQSDTLLRDTKGSIFMKTDTVDFNIPLQFKVLNKQVLVPHGGFCEFVNPDQLAMSTSSGYYDPRYNVYWNYNTGTILNYGCNKNANPLKIGLKLKTKGPFYIGLSVSQLISCVDKPKTVQNKYLSFKFNTSDLNSDVYYNLPKLADGDPYRIGFDTTLINEKKAFIVQVN